MTLQVEPRERASEDQIAAVETELGLRLPESYRRWLSTTNGCEVPRDTIVPGTGGNGLFSELEPVGALPETRKYGGHDVIPDEYLVLNIGDGGAVALKVAGGDVGSVWWGDLDRAEVLGIAEGSSQEIMLRLADDWDAFLAMDFESLT